MYIWEGRECGKDISTVTHSLTHFDSSLHSNYFLRTFSTYFDFFFNNLTSNHRTTFQSQCSSPPSSPPSPCSLPSALQAPRICAARRPFGTSFPSLSQFLSNPRNKIVSVELTVNSLEACEGQLKRSVGMTSLPRHFLDSIKKARGVQVAADVVVEKK